MTKTLEGAMELTGAESEEIFRQAFSGKTVDEILAELIYMFGEDGNDAEFAEEIFILAN